jgi:microcystin-dependent protein
MRDHKPTFRTHLAAFLAAFALVSAPAQVQASSLQLPTGSIIAFAGQSCPAGYVAADGTSVLRTTYPALYSIIGNAHGRVDSTHFNLPDMRGRFPRGADLTVGRDPDRATRTASQGGTFTVGGGSTTATSSTITVSSTADLAPGMTVTGTNITGTGYVKAILSSTTFQLGDGSRATATASGSGSGITFTFSNSAAGDYVGSVETNATKPNGLTINTMTFSGNSNIGAGGATNILIFTDQAGASGSSSSVVGGGNETRPINIALLYCIKT